VDRVDADGGVGLLGPVAQIVLLDLLLSGDNAVVIALACRRLPESVRGRAIFLGTAAAVVMRLAMALVASFLLRVPFFKIGGGLLLLAIGIDLVRGGAGEPHRGARDASHDLWHAVWVIVVADAVMSLDNVVAIAAAARGSAGLLLFGLALSVPILVFASTRLIAWLEREPVLVQAGAALLGWVAGEVIVSDPAIADFLQAQSFGLAAMAPVLGATYVLVQGRLANRPREVPMAQAAPPQAAPADIPGHLPVEKTRPRFSPMDLAVLGGLAVPVLGLVLMVLYFVWSAIAR
jgi:YjbE family integral membrane protein